MKSKIPEKIFIMAAIILFPYMLTMILYAGVPQKYTIPGDAGIKVVLDNGSKISAENYLTGLLAAAIEPDMEQEALKAQAVILRTQIYGQADDNLEIKENEITLKPLTISDMKSLWKDDFELYYLKLLNAAKSTAGECIFYDDRLITPMYHYASAGMTRSDSSGTYPYLTGADCLYDIEADNSRQIRLMTRSEAASCIKKSHEGSSFARDTVSAGDIILNTDQAGYVVNAVIDGISISGEQLQSAFSMGSPWIRFEDYRDQIRIISRGIGEGYGMSQWAAEHFAEDGKDYKWILFYFFNKTTVKMYKTGN